MRTFGTILLATEERAEDEGSARDGAPNDCGGERGLGHACLR
jgi:hypothetical protein